MPRVHHEYLTDSDKEDQVYKWLNQVFQVSATRYKRTVNYITDGGSTINKSEEAIGPWAATLSK